ncbi:cytochrome-c peroxidase [Neotamlana laminarinivorans]|uniref:Methylamine utilization protein n=1 Tax=Neotamlana laminarinivorans TaxID=2883124 RepID=A0A9X1I4C7_9FLAO|nr:cytochrome c peroxidase [Tamlana laminarinivorans]MCB4799982.1 methylamine utilization protein [Tamlana laminarinivorans]
MKIFKALWLILPLILINYSCKKTETLPEKTISTTSDSMFNDDIKQYYFQTLDSAAFYIKKIDTLKSLKENQNNLLLSRKWYKRAEPLLIAYDYENYQSMNAPNLLKIEIDDHTDIKKIKPKSYQVLEEYLFGEDTIENKELFRVYNYLQLRIPYIVKNHGILKQRDRHHLKMMRDAIVNVALKGITGFDSPVLANSLTEAIYNYESIKHVLSIYKNTLNESIYKAWLNEIELTIKTLNQGNFDSFDRYSFIKKHTNKQLKLINQTANAWNIELSTSRALNPKSTNVFSETFFNKKMFSPPHTPKITEKSIALGKALFNDTSLSGSGTISCATCHIKEKAFTDGNKIALGTNGQPLLRNTPTLPYAVYQRSFFYDGRGDGLEGQIVGVTNNKNEFHIDLKTLEENIKAKPEYKQQFDSIYKGKITNRNIRNAIASYIRSLTPFNSKFDRNMQDLENTLTKKEVLGFNLFMGKAACATCHFPPTFYGTVPPKFAETEFEHLGLTKTSDFENPVLDNDPGLYYPYEVEERRGYFKTSTVRNIALTAPYMHNGAFETLEQVLEFYNLGGGQGLGLDVPYQTLPPTPLDLNENEIDAIIAFMNTLTDKDYENY